MARSKIDYGIDLGTTNSALCRMEKGTPTIIKTDTQKDTLPSCVSFTKKKSAQVGDSAYNTNKSNKCATMKYMTTGNEEKIARLPEAYIEFKRKMATDYRYHNNFMERDYTPEELSAEVLKTLKSFVSDETVSSVVVTVPAKFDQNQKAATMQAARLAGFRKCELLQEPIAAAYAYGLREESKDGVWMVFDFGGGTFDVALLRVEDGILQVFATAGDNYLGGKDLDYAIADEILIPYLQENYNFSDTLADTDKRAVVRDAMKTFAEEAKNQLSSKESVDILSDLGDLGEDDDGEEVELDIKLTREDAYRVMRPIFQKAVDICKTLLREKNMKGSDLDKLILVGGPTHSALIRDMLREQITKNVDTSADPMTVVAQGAALYASSIDADVAEEEIEQEAVRLELTYDSTTVESTLFAAVKLNEKDSRSEVLVEMVRNVGTQWTSGRVRVNKTGDVIELDLVENKPNSFSIRCFDTTGNVLPCFPDEITITQGTKVGAAVLPYNYAIGVYNTKKQRVECWPVEGLEQNKPLPATGVVNGLFVSEQLRPGVATDEMTVPVYQVEADDVALSKGRPGYLYRPVDEIKITGDDIEQLVKQNAKINITLKIDSSEQLTMDFFFPETEEDVTGKSNPNSIKNLDEIREKTIPECERNGRNTIAELKKLGIDTSKEEQELEAWAKEREHDINEAPDKVLDHLQQILRRLEAKNDKADWMRVEKELRQQLDKTEKAQQENGDTDTGRKLEELRRRADDVVRRRDADMARDVIEELGKLFVDINRLEMLIGFILFHDDRFGSIAWKNASRARQLINQGLQAIQNNPSIRSLQPIVNEICDCMVDPSAAGAGGHVHR